MGKPVRPPDVGELRAFCLAADLGSIGRAAVALRISQPGVSKRLRSLEALAGAELLKRSPQGVVLTEAGRALYPEAQKLLGQVAAVEAVLARFGGDRTPVLLAVSHTIAEHYLPPRLVAYDARGAHPPIELSVANSAAVRAMVAEGRADLGLVAAGPEAEVGDGLQDWDLVADEIVVAVPQDHLWYQRESIPRREFLRTSMIVRDPEAHSRRLVDGVLADEGERLAAPVAELGSTAAAKREAIERSVPLLLSALALDERRDRLYRREIEGLAFPRRFVAVCRSEHLLTPPQRALLEFLVAGP